MVGWSDHITEYHPKVAIFDYSPIEPPELLRFVQIIMTEGVPYVCAKFPLAFEFARERAAESLGLSSKQLSVTGSARLGYSLRPDAFGRPFDEAASDIDLFVVDTELFEGVANDFQAFIGAWDTEKIAPTEREKIYWQSSKKRDPLNIQEGFLDTHHIPAKKGFRIADRVLYAAIVFDKNLEEQVGRKIGDGVRIRVYRDWSSAVRRIRYNIKSALKYRADAAGQVLG